LITRYAGENNLRPELVAAVIYQESGGNPLAYSKSGAVGLMQVMPRDGLAVQFQCQNGPCFADRPTRSELENPEFNVAYGTHMLAGLIGRYQSVREALRAYGPMDMGYGYADIVLAHFERFNAAD
jgi:soluble lytic murein transglycosylase-like protein